mgnify:CR=1 FL=1
MEIKKNERLANRLPMIYPYKKYQERDYPLFTSYSPPIYIRRE